MLSDFGIDLIIHRLELLSIGNSWYEEIWLLINVSTPWLIEKFISDKIFIFTKLLGSLTPEGSEFISQTIVIIIKIAYCRADGMSEMVFGP